MEGTNWLDIRVNDTSAVDVLEPISDVEDLKDIMEEVFDGVHDLYVKGGARNFAFVDVPPVDRSPQGAQER